jgi:hypothetical protein
VANGNLTGTDISNNSLTGDDVDESSLAVNANTTDGASVEQILFTGAANSAASRSFGTFVLDMGCDGGGDLSISADTTTENGSLVAADVDSNVIEADFGSADELDLETDLSISEGNYAHLAYRSGAETVVAHFVGLNASVPLTQCLVMGYAIRTG